MRHITDGEAGKADIFFIHKRKVLKENLSKVMKGVEWHDWFISKVIKYNGKDIVAQTYEQSATMIASVLSEQTCDECTSDYVKKKVDEKLGYKFKKDEIKNVFKLKQANKIIVDAGWYKQEGLSPCIRPYRIW